MIRLNCGSGYLPLPDYINIDIKSDEPNFAVDLILDLRKLKDHFKDNSVDEIFAKDSLEHIGWREVPKTLQDWVDILKPGGVLKIRVPDTDRIMDWCFSHRNDKNSKEIFQRTIHIIFGDQNFTENNHLSGFRKDFLVEDLEKMGMRLGIEPWYDGGRDLRLSMIKGQNEPLVTLDHPDYKYKELSHAQHRALFK